MKTNTKTGQYSQSQVENNLNPNKNPCKVKNVVFYLTFASHDDDDDDERCDGDDDADDDDASDGCS